LKYERKSYGPESEAELMGEKSEEIAVYTGLMELLSYIGKLSTDERSEALWKMK